MSRELTSKPIAQLPNLNWSTAIRPNSFFCQMVHRFDVAYITEKIFPHSTKKKIPCITLKQYNPASHAVKGM